MSVRAPVSDRRLVLFPHGQPAALPHRNRCLELLLRAGGDLGRIIDAPAGRIEQFATYCSRIRGIREGTEQVMVVLTRTNPLALTVLDTRSRLEAKLPMLRHALWVIFFSPEDDPFFMASAERLGQVHGKLAGAPFWEGPRGRRFLVLSPMVKDERVIGDRVRQWDLSDLSETGERWINTPDGWSDDEKGGKGWGA